MSDAGSDADALRDEQADLQLARTVRKAGSWLKTLVAVFVPTVLFVVLYLKLSKSAIWLPQEYRLLVTGLGLFVGLSCFGAARRCAASFFRPPLKPGGRLSRQRQSEYEKERAEAAYLAQMKRWLWAGGSFVVFAVLLAVQIVLHNDRVHRWEPSNSTVDLLFYEQFGTAMPAMESVPHAIHSDPCYLEKVGEGSTAMMKGSFLFPFGFIDSDEAKSLVASMAAIHGAPQAGTERQFLIDHAPLDLKELISSSFASDLGKVKAVFFILYLMTVACLAVAYGFVFKWSDDLVSALADLAV